MKFRVLNWMGSVLVMIGCQTLSPKSEPQAVSEDFVRPPRMAAKAGIGFMDICQDPQAPAASRHTVQQLLAAVEIQNCQEAWSQLQKFTSLDLTANQISDLTPLIGMTELMDLTLTLNHVENIAPLALLPNLRELFLGDNDLKDISALSYLTELKTLDLNRNEIKDIGALKVLKKLEWLDLSENQVEGLIALSSHDRLKFLSLSSNKIESIEPLADLSRLEELYLQHNFITNLTPISQLPWLLGLDAEDNPLQKNANSCPTEGKISAGLRDFCSAQTR